MIIHLSLPHVHDVTILIFFLSKDILHIVFAFGPATCQHT